MRCALVNLPLILWNTSEDNPLSLWTCLIRSSCVILNSCDQSRLRITALDGLITVKDSGCVLALRTLYHASILALSFSQYLDFLQACPKAPVYYLYPFQSWDMAKRDVFSWYSQTIATGGYCSLRMLLPCWTCSTGGRQKTCDRNFIVLRPVMIMWLP